MTTFIQRIWQQLFAARRSQDGQAAGDTEQLSKTRVSTEAMDIPTNDPLLAYLVSSGSPVEIDKLTLQSPTLSRLKEEGIKISVPLVSQGELIGLLNLGPRLSEQEYSSEDRRLLNNLATQAAPALRVAQLARQQQAEARERERMEQELRVARIIQQTLLPKQIPEPDGWRISAYWQPAREVGGDFYDFVPLPDGRLGILIADVTDKGVPAALVMATTRSLLRGAAERLISPARVLESTNDLLHPDIPPKMFVTCLYAVLNPQTGRLVFANAGHNLPYQCSQDGVKELRATGMPLGLMPGMQYEETEVMLNSGDHLLLLSDGLVEAHDPERKMYGLDRLRAVLSAHSHQLPLIETVLASYRSFTGAAHEQEDDITLVTIEFTAAQPDTSSRKEWQELDTFSMPSAAGNERLVAERVLKVVHPLIDDTARLPRMETAVAEAALNAIEHGNKYDETLPVEVDVQQRGSQIRICIRDQGGGKPIPQSNTPDLEAKLAGEQSPRGWGLFLIRNMVDDLHLQTEEHHTTIQLIFNLPAAGQQGAGGSENESN